MTDKKMYFGFAPVKQEGMTSSFEHPQMGCWEGLTKARDSFISRSYTEWYWFPIRNRLRTAMKSGWDSALLERQLDEWTKDMGD